MRKTEAFLRLQSSTSNWKGWA